MTARCHEDSCSIKWSEVSTLSGPAYQAVVDVDGTSISCVEGPGLGVLISPNSGNLISNAGNGIFASLPNPIMVEFGENATSDPNAAQVNAQVADGVVAAAPQLSPFVHTWTNSTGRKALVVVTASFNLDFAILGEGSAENTTDLIRCGAVAFPDEGDGVLDVVPYNAQWHARLRWGINNVATPNTGVQDKFETSGMLSTFQGAGVFQFKRHRNPFADSFIVLPGQALSIRADIAHDGSDQTLNVVARGSGSLAGLGFGLRDMKLGIIPMGV